MGDQRLELIAVTCFIGNLFTRKVCHAGVPTHIVKDLIEPSRRVIRPAVCVRAACALIEVIGKYMDSSEIGHMVVTSMVAHLCELAVMKTVDGSFILPEEIRDLIRAIMKKRLNQWKEYIT